MLPVHLQELLTASIDGELSNAENRVVSRLLQDSVEAREFHAQLLENAKRLRESTPIQPPVDIASNILNIIQDRCITPTPLPSRRPSRRPYYVQYLLPVAVSLAAVVLILVSVSTYYLFSSRSGEIAKNQPDQKSQKPKVNTPKEKVLPPQVNPKKSTTPYLEPKSISDPTKDLAHKSPPKQAELLPPPRVHDIDSLLTTPEQPEAEPFRQVQILVRTLILPVRDLDQAYPKKQWRDELSKRDFVRIDLFCKGSSQSAETINRALQTRGLHLNIEANAHDRIKKKLPTEFVYFTENLSMMEIAQLFEQLGSQDKKREDKKTGDGQFDKFVLAPYHPDDLRLLSRLLGVAPSALKMPKFKPAVSFDAKKSLESSTAMQLAQSLSKSSQNKSAKQAIVLTNGPVYAKPHLSKEIKSFLEKRTDRTPGSVPLLLVLRSIDE